MSRIGRKHIDVPAGVSVSYADNVVTVKGKLGELKQSIASNDITVKIGAGVVNVEGVGYKCAVTGNKLVMNIGYSKPVEFTVPDGITVTCPDPLTIVVSGIDKCYVGQVAAQIKSKRPVEPYHGYGLHYSDEVVLRKEAKTAGKK